MAYSSNPYVVPNFMDGFEQGFSALMQKRKLDLEADSQAHTQKIEDAKLQLAQSQDSRDQQRLQSQIGIWQSQKREADARADTLEYMNSPDQRAQENASKQAQIARENAMARQANASSAAEYSRQALQDYQLTQAKNDHANQVVASNAAAMYASNDWGAPVLGNPKAMDGINALTAVIEHGAPIPINPDMVNSSAPFIFKDEMDQMNRNLAGSSQSNGIPGINPGWDPTAPSKKYVGLQITSVNTPNNSDPDHVMANVVAKYVDNQGNVSYVPQTPLTMSKQEAIGKLTSLNNYITAAKATMNAINSVPGQSKIALSQVPDVFESHIRQYQMNNRDAYINTYNGLFDRANQQMLGGPRNQSQIDMNIVRDMSGQFSPQEKQNAVARIQARQQGGGLLMPGYNQPQGTTIGTMGTNGSVDLSGYAAQRARTQQNAAQGGAGGGQSSSGATSQPQQQSDQQTTDSMAQ